jgi:pimeloyl-ACP methyl ester carboxylesterase
MRAVHAASRGLPRRSAQAGLLNGAVMEKVHSGDATISYTKTGAGPTLVLVHGGWSDHIDIWRAVLPALEKRFTCLTIARRGRGESSKTSGHTIDDEATDILAIIDAAGDDVYVLGHSYGARCALAAAARSPRVSRLILYEPPGDVASPLRPVIEAGMRQEWDAMLELFMGAQMASAVRPTPTWNMLVRHAEATLEELHAIARARWDPGDFRALRLPVLLLKGTESPADLLVTTDELASAMPDASIAVLKGQGHMAMWTAPTEFVRCIEEFLPGAQAQ